MTVNDHKERLETLSLLKLLAIGTGDVEAGRTRPIRDIIARLRAKRAAR